MRVLTGDPERSSINNGGLVGDSEGVIPESWTAFYYGAGCGMQEDPRIHGRWPPDRARGSALPRP
jgi:hypothetical protein